MAKNERYSGLDLTREEKKELAETKRRIKKLGRLFFEDMPVVNARRQDFKMVHNGADGLVPEFDGRGIA